MTGADALTAEQERLYVEVLQASLEDVARQLVHPPVHCVSQRCIQCGLFFTSVAAEDRRHCRPCQEIAERNQADGCYRDARFYEGGY